MPTHRITVDLSEAAYNVLREHVDSGLYASESECIALLLSDWNDALPAPMQEGTPEYEQWLREQVLAADDELTADPSSGYTPDEVRAILAEERSKLAKAG
jgi:Arc/MetJ-type ribon-helix-helix transcriptional regulator